MASISFWLTRTHFVNFLALAFLDNSAKNANRELVLDFLKQNTVPTKPSNGGFDLSSPIVVKHFTEALIFLNKEYRVDITEHNTRNGARQLGLVQDYNRDVRLFYDAINEIRLKCMFTQ